MKKIPIHFRCCRLDIFSLQTVFQHFLVCWEEKREREKKVIISFLVMLEIFFLLLFHFHLALFNHCLLLMKFCTNNLITNALRFVIFFYVFIFFRFSFIFHLGSTPFTFIYLFRCLFQFAL